MDTSNAYKDFTKRFQLFVGKHPNVITTTLSNIFTMRLIGNKTHGDLAEIAISEFINQYMYDFSAQHVGKELFRAKKQEEDIRITNEITNLDFPVSLKAYGDGPLQLSTDKNAAMFPCLERKGEVITGNEVQVILENEAFSNLMNMNVLPLIYNEKKKKCNILIFNHVKAMNATQRIEREEPKGRRKHPVYVFYNQNNDYICEVRYGGKRANALQRGLWTHTKRALNYFDSLTNGWVSYEHNHILVSLFSHALITSQKGHHNALEILKEDIEHLKQSENLL